MPPRAMAVSEMTHQIPLVPKSSVVTAKMDRGMRTSVSPIEVTIGGIVIPAPLKAPCRTISTASGTRQNAMMERKEEA